MIEALYFVVLFFVYQVPCLIIRLFKKETLENILNKEDTEEEDVPPHLLKQK